MLGCRFFLQQLLRLAPQDLERHPPVPRHSRSILGALLRRLLDVFDRFVKALFCFVSMVQALLGHGLEKPSVDNAGPWVRSFLEGGFGLRQWFGRLLEAAGA